ncbi:MAG: PhzF family phenazine biosynthesis protein [Cellvibrionaceae bacterium]
MDFYIVDAFTNEPFKGNPAAVVILKEEKTAIWMQKIAAEFNLSETAFLNHKKNNQWALRWFTPTVEVNLCGHATLASARTLHEFIDTDSQEFIFHTKSGELLATISEDDITLDFPAIDLKPFENFSLVENVLGEKLENCMANERNIFAELENESAIINFSPNYEKISSLKTNGIVITARSTNKNNSIDFVSRYFAPNAGIPEDPVTGSIHCALAPYWSKKLNKKILTAKQCSSREGILNLTVKENGRIELKGKSVIFSKGKIRM